MNISLPPELERVIQSKVESGLYPNANEVVREALRQMDSSEHFTHESKLAGLKDALAEGIRQAKAGDTAPFELHELIVSLNSRK